MHIMLTFTLLICMLECTNIHIAAAKKIFDILNSINVANNNVWVPYDINPRGPKKKWVPTSPPRVFDVGVGSHMT